MASAGIPVLAKGPDHHLDLLLMAGGAEATPDTVVTHHRQMDPGEEGEPTRAALSSLGSGGCLSAPAGTFTGVTSSKLGGATCRLRGPGRCSDEVSTTPCRTSLSSTMLNTF
ncbi:hypothetical protein NDU88_007510 [Pleurodeles waltl]|uniref:Uncharacterized protein n=1 Tax=Pleurodeles waltl TaxID=8319 RepID=A0AAV7U3A8_PLEWA|nr:hypothetical protein NDU88_007510 [Pleurodeles waltl]